MENPVNVFSFKFTFGCYYVLHLHMIFININPADLIIKLKWIIAGNCFILIKYSRLLLLATFWGSRSIGLNSVLLERRLYSMLSSEGLFLTFSLFAQDPWQFLDRTSWVNAWVKLQGQVHLSSLDFTCPNLTRPRLTWTVPNWPVPYWFDLSVLTWLYLSQLYETWPGSTCNLTCPFLIYPFWQWDRFMPGSDIDL